MGQECDRQEDQKRLVGLEVFGDPDAIRVFKYVETADKEQSRSEVDSKGDGDVASNI